MNVWFMFITYVSQVWQPRDPFFGDRTFLGTRGEMRNLKIDGNTV